MPSALLNFGTAGVSKADLRFVEPFARCGAGVLGTMLSSLDTCKYPAANWQSNDAYMPKTSSPFPVLLGVANAPLLSTLRTWAFPRASRSSIS